MAPVRRYPAPTAAVLLEPPPPVEPTAPPPGPRAEAPPTPVESGLRLVTQRLGVPAALLFAADAGGALRVVDAVGTWGGDAHALRGLAEALDTQDVLDVAGTIDGARFAAGARLGDGEGALLVIAPDDLAPDDAWHAAFADAAGLALGLVRSVGARRDMGGLLHEIAVHPGRFDERLGLALRRAAEALGLDAAVLSRVDGGLWTPETVFDPSERLVPLHPVSLAETLCAVTIQSDGPFAVHDASGPPGPAGPAGAYLGAPVFVGGRCAGTFAAVGFDPRARPFSEDERALVESLARWVGSAVSGRDAARQLAEREAQLHALLTQAPLALFATDADGRVAYGRGRVLQEVGLDPEHAVGRPLRSLLPEADGPVRSALAGHDAVWTVEAGARAFEVRVQPRRDEDGHAAGLIGVALDVTDHRRARAATEAAAASRAELLKHINHEIRSPLTSILGYSDLLSRDTPPDEVAEVRDVIGRAGERLLAALDDLLDLTLLDESEVAAHPAPTDVVALVSDVAESSRPAAEAQRIALNLWCTLPEAPLMVDPALFERVARHLIGGAVASAEAPRIDVRLAAAGEDWVELSVLGGAPPDGAGLGADVIHRLVAAMGGTSTEVAGSAPGWVVRLPRTAVPVVDLGDGAATRVPTMDG